MGLLAHAPAKGNQPLLVHTREDDKFDMQNWTDEIRKWLGAERMKALVLQPGPEAKQQVRTMQLSPAVKEHTQRVSVILMQNAEKHACM